MTKRLILYVFMIIGTFVIGFVSYTNTYITTLGDITMIKRSAPITSQSTFTGIFTALYDQLGTIRIRVKTEGRINTNTLVFRLREKGQTNWIVENTYKTDRFIDGELYPFGFSIITNSKGRIYEYELSSPDGTRNNTVIIMSGPYSLQTDYNYSFSQLRSDFKLGKWFFQRKIQELFKTYAHLLYWCMCLIPLFLFMNNGKKKYSNFTTIFLLLFFMSNYIFSPLMIHSNFPLYIGIIFAAVVTFNKKSYWIYSYAFVALCILVTSIFFGKYDWAIKSSYLVWTLLIVGTISNIVQYRYE
ncbi:MAG: hypothetical protein C0412_14790 [Flavobacterium sp.]|nr:hypothetical protein [Flavobacterium sp.]